MSEIHNVDQYIDTFPLETQLILKKIRDLLQKLLPGASENISYGIPTYKIKSKNIIHFGGYAKHISIYPGSQAVEHFLPRLKGFKTSRGTIQFSLSTPIPLYLIKEIAAYCRLTNSN